MLTSKIERCNSGFVINIDGDRVPTYAYISYQPSMGRYEDFKKAGFKLFSTAVYTGDRGINQSSGTRPFRPPLWLDEENFDFSAVDEDFRIITGTSQPGEVYILPRFMLEPPSWWENKHPEAWCLDASGVNTSHCSFSSDVWLNACEKVMRCFQAWLEESGWDRYVIGWHLAAGNTEEFIRPLTHENQFLDYSEASRQAFRNWLSEKYGTIEKLNFQWKSRFASFEEISIPTPAQRAFALRGDLRDDELEMNVIDFYRFYNREVSLFAQKLVRLGHTITENKQIMGIFYGNMTLAHTEHAHNDVGILLNDPQVDFMASPFAYTRSRGQGIHWGFQGDMESANLHGKPFFVESDVRTCLSRPISQCMPYANPYNNDLYDADVWYGPKDVPGSLGQMIKAFGDVVTHHAATWWFDMWGGWYMREEFMDFQKKAYKIYEENLLDNTIHPQAAVAVFVDEDGLNYFSPTAGNAINHLLQEQMRELGSSGAMYHSYLLSDLDKVNPDDYRLALCPFPAKLTSHQRSLLETWASKGRTVLYTILPDYYGNGITAQTGIPCSEIRGETMSVTGIWNGISFPPEPVTLPHVTLQPEYTDIVLARLSNGEPGVVLRRSEDAQIVLSLTPCVPAGLIRKLVGLSSGHVYNFTGECLSANSRYICIHAASDGTKRLYLPCKGKLQDVFSEEILPGNETFVDIRMKFGESRMFRLIPTLP